MDLMQKIEAYMQRKVDFSEVLISTVDDLDGSPKITKTRKVKYTDETGEEKTRIETYEEYKPAIPVYIKQWNITDKPQPTQEQLDAITEPFIPTPTLEEQKIQILINYFNDFYPELQAFFKPAKDAVVMYYQKKEYDKALRVVQKYPLTQGYIFDDGNGSSKTLEDYRQDLINILQGE